MKSWYQPRLTFMTGLLWPLSLLTKLIVRIRIFRRNRSRYRAPVIVVGNLTVGGTGKTPTLIWLCRALIEHGYRPLIVSRGYGASAKLAKPHVVKVGNRAAEVGDEPLLLFRTLKVPVVIDPNRDRAVRAGLMNHPDVDVVLSDDGLQHFKMFRDIELLLVDPKRGLGNSHLLPAGPLREPVSAIQRADFLLAKSNPNLATITVPFVAKRLPKLAKNSQLELPPGRIRAAAGIGNFEQFIDDLESLGYEVSSRFEAQDHQPLPDKILSGTDLPLVVTEKDFVKIDNPGPNHYFLPYELSYPDDLLEGIVAKLKENKP